MRTRIGARLIVLGLALGAGVTSVSLAMPRFRLAAIQQFHYDADYPLWQYDKRAMSCTFCHVSASGGAPWNSFGQSLRAQFVRNAATTQAAATQGSRAAQNKFPQVLYDLLRAGQDADGDGYPDVLEVFARTLPGDAGSKPTQPLAQLRQAFEAAGGVEQYRPASTR